MSDIQRALDEQARLEAEATPGEWWHTHVYAGEEVIRYGEPPETLLSMRSFEDATLIAHLRNQAALARAVIEATNAAEHLIRQHLGPFCSPILDALAAWANYVNGET